MSPAMKLRSNKRNIIMLMLCYDFKCASVCCSRARNISVSLVFHLFETEGLPPNLSYNCVTICQKNLASPVLLAL